MREREREREKERKREREKERKRERERERLLLAGQGLENGSLAYTKFCVPLHQRAKLEIRVQILIHRRIFLY